MKHLPPEEQYKRDAGILQDYIEDIPVNEIALTHGIKPDTVYQIAKKYNIWRKIKRFDKVRYSREYKQKNYSAMVKEPKIIKEKPIFIPRELTKGEQIIHDRYKNFKLIAFSSRDIRPTDFDHDVAPKTYREHFSQVIYK